MDKSAAPRSARHARLESVNTGLNSQSSAAAAGSTPRVPAVGATSHPETASSWLDTRHTEPDSSTVDLNDQRDSGERRRQKSPTAAPDHVAETGDAASESKNAKWVFDAITKIAAPTAVVSALLYYYGWTRTRTLFDQFGVNAGVLGYSSTDYLLRSGVVFKPIAYAVIALAAAAAVALSVEHLERQTHFYGKHLFNNSELTIGRLLYLLPVICAGAAWWWGLHSSRHPLAAALAVLCSGAAVIVIYRLHSVATARKPPAIWLMVGLSLVTVGAFWWVDIYAANQGRAAAASIDAPPAIIYSKDPLPLAGDQSTQNTNPAAAPWNFRYTDYRVLAYADHRWILIPADPQSRAPTVLLPDSDAIRIQFQPKNADANTVPPPPSQAPAPSPALPEQPPAPPPAATGTPDVIQVPGGGPRVAVPLPQTNSAVNPATGSQRVAPRPTATEPAPVPGVAPPPPALGPEPGTSADTTQDIPGPQPPANAGQPPTCPPDGCPTG
jgi:hypothetical protein